MPRKEATGVKETGGYTESADERYLHGSPGEVKNRSIDDRFGPTESHFAQIRPETASPRGKNINEQAGSTRNNRPNITHRGGKGG